MSLPSKVPGVLGNTSLRQFDVIIIGSGAGGSMAARTLTVAGSKKVLVLESGPNYFLGLDDPAPHMPLPLFSNDEIKLTIRTFIDQDPLLEPRTYRTSATVDAAFNENVNTLPRNVGGAAVHADMKYPRFNAVDFRIASELQANGINYAGTNFSDWPVTYDELEPFYTEAELLTGVQGKQGVDPFASHRSGDYLMPPGVPMYVAEVLSAGVSAEGYTPFAYPSAVNSRPYRGRPPCNDCGFCSGYGCPNNSKSSPAVTTLREALLTGNCQLRYNCMVTRLVNNGNHVTGVEYVDSAGNRQQATADQFIVAASAIESARLCLLSEVGNSSDTVGRNLMFHFQTIAVGIFKQRFHGERGRSVTHGFADFRGVMPRGEAIDPSMKLGGIIEFGTDSEAITAAKNNLRALAFGQGSGVKITLKQLLINSPFLARTAAMTMQAEDAPQLTNRVDLDPKLVDVFGSPVSRITYANSRYELDARIFYNPKLVAILQAAGAQFGFIAPPDSPSQSAHVMGTLRMGNDPTVSVCDAFGKFHDVDNLYCMDGSVLTSSSGYNPTLTIITLALRAAGNIVYPGSPERVIGQ
jgi:choline dehydrogenase-like flavoprotein